jgi:hypothetical protein
MAASILRNRFFGKTWKIDGTLRRKIHRASLSTGIQISHNDVKHLPCLPRIAFRNGRLRSVLSVNIGVISIRPRDGRQPRAPAANKPSALRNGEPRLERPIGNHPRGRTRGSQRNRPFVFQRVGHNGFQDSAGSAQRQVIVLLLEGASAVDVGLLENRPELRVVNEFKSAGRRRLR